MPIPRHRRLPHCLALVTKNRLIFFKRQGRTIFGAALFFSHITKEPKKDLPIRPARLAQGEADGGAGTKDIFMFFSLCLGALVAGRLMI